MACVEEVSEATSRPFSPRPLHLTQWSASSPGSPANKAAAQHSITQANSMAGMPSSCSGAWSVDIGHARGHTVMCSRQRASLDNFAVPVCPTLRLPQRASVDMGSVRGPVAMGSGPFASGSNAGLNKSGKLLSRRGSLEALQQEKSKGQLSPASPSGRLRTRVSFADSPGKNLMAEAEELEQLYSPNKDGKRLALEPISQLFKEGLASPEDSFCAPNATSGSLSSLIPVCSNPASCYSLQTAPTALSNSGLAVPRTPSAHSMRRPDNDAIPKVAIDAAPGSAAAVPVKAKPAKMTDRLLARFRALL